MADLKPAYLIHGDDHGRVAERRAGLRAMAEATSGASGLETLEGDEATAEHAAGALNAMTFAIGRRFIVVEGVHLWKDKEVETHLAPALAAMPPDTTIAFFGRDEGRSKTPAALVKAVEKAGGVVAVHAVLKAKELPRWVQGEAKRLQLDLDQGAARALVARVGDRQQRLLRELETLALEHGPGARLGAEEIDDVASRSAERQVWSLGDAIVAGDRKGALRIWLDLREQGEQLPRLIPTMAGRLRDTLSVAARLEAGESPAAIKASIKPPWKADRSLREARGVDAETLRRALEALAALEIESRGLGDLHEETAALRALERMVA